MEEVFKGQRTPPCIVKACIPETWHLGPAKSFPQTTAQKPWAPGNTSKALFGKPCLKPLCLIFNPTNRCSDYLCLQIFFQIFPLNTHQFLSLSLWWVPGMNPSALLMLGKYSTPPQFPDGFLSLCPHTLIFYFSYFFSFF